MQKEPESSEPEHLVLWESRALTHTHTMITQTNTAHAAHRTCSKYSQVLAFDGQEEVLAEAWQLQLAVQTAFSSSSYTIAHQHFWDGLCTETSEAGM